METKSSRPLLLFYLLVGYVLIQFAWWSYLMVEQNNELYQLKSTVNQLHQGDPDLLVRLNSDLEKKLHAKWWMIGGEGLVFFTLLSIGFFRVRNTFKREAALSLQQKNFMHSVTHELKSPIASVKLAMETLLKRELDKEKQKEIFGNALADAERLHKLVENILLAARIENSFDLHKENLNVSEYTEEVVKQAQRMLNPKQTIVYDIQPNVFFSIDKNSFSSVILNLFENAMKYSPENTSIIIKLKEQGSGIVLTVDDEGQGISDVEKPNVFKKFYRVGNEETRRSKGTGLGLYIVKYLVEKHGGTVLIKNNIPKGSRFEISIPA